MIAKKEISLEEKLRKLLVDKKAHEKKVEEKDNKTRAEHEKKLDEKLKKKPNNQSVVANVAKDSKETLPEKQVRIFESDVVAKTDLQNIAENKELVKNETLEQTIADVEPLASDKKETKPESINYSISGKSGDINNYQTGNPKNTLGNKYDPTTANINRNLNRDQNNSPGIIGSRLYNPFNTPRGDAFAYANNYSSESGVEEKDGMRMYEESKQKFYETSHRDIHDKKSNKNI